jgi:hypothetical protein
MEVNGSEVPLMLFQVVRFIYTGDAVITSDNVCKLLQASEFFGLEDFEEVCIRFLNLPTSKPYKNTLEMLSIACATNRSLLIDTLVAHVTEYFEDFSKGEDFVDIPFNILRRILTRQCMNGLVKDAIVRWINHSSEERQQYFDELTRVVEFENCPSISVNEECM